MKATRDQLKALMKELLIEILTEGLGNVPSASRPPAPGRMPINPIAGMQTESRLANGRRKPAFDPRLDSPVGGGRAPTDALREAVKREAGGNPIMADILADTAMTTLPSQLSHGDAMGSPVPGAGAVPGMTQQEQFHGDPTEIFGLGGQVREDGSSHWADLAFMPSNKKSA